MYWGHGYATEAARALVRFGFQELHLHWLWASCNAENQASARVLAKAGMQPEGRLRENEWFKAPRKPCHKEDTKQSLFCDRIVSNTSFILTVT